jgi:hypothetical protein
LNYSICVLYLEMLAVRECIEVLRYFFVVGLGTSNREAEDVGPVLLHEGLLLVVACAKHHCTTLC